MAAWAAPAHGASPLHTEFINGDLSNTPVGAPLYVVGPGVTWLAQGVIATFQTDVDFISFAVPFASTRVVADIDTNFLHQDSVLGVAVGPGNYPTAFNDDDLDNADDALAGTFTNPRDSVFDLTTLFGAGPVPAGTVFTLAIARQGDQFLWNGGGNLDIKLEYKVWVYTDPVPGPGAGGLLALGVVAAARRRRR
jgi:MYXO-CTERM domain-containing protein